ncbi:SCP-like protein [Ancylostoma duodenale]|uniref:SCP-like protein n=1 Tax=Ancylostoma duodenale TaxID=51022 RepID=A0A0C2GTY1_9BILA|nr:SCP-like protein [Ancylostoma duodenale]
MWGILLKWDCNLEELAYRSLQSLMSTCEVPFLSISKPYQTMQVRTANVSVANRVIYEAAQNEQGICSACGNNCIRSLCQVNHTPVTLPTTCPDDQLMQGSNSEALWMHNYYRRLLASGWAKDTKSESGYALPGKKMLKLEYDCASGGGTNGATKTYDLIKDCPKTDPQATNGYSLNFLRLSNYTISEQEALEQAIKKWWGVLETKGLGSEYTFSENSEIASFAKMAHDETQKVACAVKNCKDKGQTLVACQYTPGIQNDEKIYETGKVCSGCRGLNKKCSDPAGLCE